MNAAMLADSKLPELPEWLRELYPFRTRTFFYVTPKPQGREAGPTGGCTMSFLDEGAPDAAPVVLVHGNATWSFLFRSLVPRLAPNSRVIAPDHVGFGLSDKPVDPAYHTLQQHIRNFTALIEALGLRRLTLVAHGWGGPMALAYAATHPHNLARLVLVNTWAGNLPDTPHSKPLALRVAESGRVGAFLDDLLKLSLNANLCLRPRRPISDLVIEAYNYPFSNPASRAGIHAFTRMFFEPDVQTRATQDEICQGLKNIDAPVDILCGAHDALLSKLPAYLLRDSLRQAREPVFLDVGHLIPEEAPDALAEIVLRADAPAAGAQHAGSLFKILG